MASIVSSWSVRFTSSYSTHINKSVKTRATTKNLFTITLWQQQHAETIVFPFCQPVCKYLHTSRTLSATNISATSEITHRKTICGFPSVSHLCSSSTTPTLPQERDRIDIGRREESHRRPRSPPTLLPPPPPPSGSSSIFDSSRDATAA